MQGPFVRFYTTGQPFGSGSFTLQHVLSRSGKINELMEMMMKGELDCLFPIREATSTCPGAREDELAMMAGNQQIQDGLVRAFQLVLGMFGFMLRRAPSGEPMVEPVELFPQLAQSWRTVQECMIFVSRVVNSMWLLGQGRLAQSWLSQLVLVGQQLGPTWVQWLQQQDATFTHQQQLTSEGQCANILASNIEQLCAPAPPQDRPPALLYQGATTGGSQCSIPVQNVVGARQWAVCARNGCPCDSHNGVIGEYCSMDCRRGRPCFNKIHEHTLPNPQQQFVGSAQSFPAGVPFPQQQPTVERGDRTCRCARSSCPCEAFDGQAGSHCCIRCKRGVPCDALRHRYNHAAKVFLGFLSTPSSAQQGGARSAPPAAYQSIGTYAINSVSAAIGIAHGPQRPAGTARCANLGCSCDSFDGSVGQYCCQTCRSGAPCRTRVHTYNPHVAGVAAQPKTNSKVKVCDACKYRPAQPSGYCLMCMSCH